MIGLVKQLSIFVNNEPGAFAATARAMKECKVNIKAFSIAESIGFGVFRAIVDEPEKKAEELRKKGLVVKLTDVVAVEMKTAPGSLYDEAEKFAGTGLNIEYAYAYNGDEHPILYLRFDDAEKALSYLKKN